MRALLQREPALAAAIASLIGAVIGIFVGNPALAASLGGVVLALLGVRQVVTPVTSAAADAVTAARQAGLAVARDLAASTAGAAGELTDAGRAAVTAAVGEVLR